MQARSLLWSLLDTPWKGKNGWSRIWSRARYVSMQHMHPHVLMGLLMQLGCYHNHDARPSTNQSKGWHCPACQVLSDHEERRETWRRRTESKIWLVNWEPTSEAAKMIRSNPIYVLKNGWGVRDKQFVHLWHENWTHRQKHGQPGLARIKGSQQAYSPMEIYARQTSQGQSSFWHATYR